MSSSEIISPYLQNKKIRELSEYIGRARPEVIAIRGLKGSSKTAVSAFLHKSTPSDKLFVLPTQEDARYFYNDLETFLPGENIFFFPSSFKNDDPAIRYNPLELERLNVLNVIKKHSSKGRVIVSYPLALYEFVISESELDNSSVQLKKGQKTDIDFLIEFLAGYGFEATEFVREAGYFAVRGFILDVFSYANSLPYRIEFDDDVIESIREFDPETQLSTRRLNSLTILPKFTQQNRQRLAFTDYISKDTIIFTDNLAYINESIRKIQENFDSIRDKSERYYYQDPDALFSGFESHRWIDLSTEPFVETAHTVEFNSSPQTSFNKNFDLLAKELSQNTEKGFVNYIFSDSSRQIERIYEIFEDKGIEVPFTPVYQSIRSGFKLQDLKVAFYSEHEIFQRFLPSKSKKYYSKDRALSLKELYELKPGDYVTHINNGIGRFSGLEKIENNGKVQEALRIEYKDGDLLYVSVHALHKISRYSGREGTVPRIHRLGSKSWEKVKNKTKSRVKDIARDLIKLYAQRKSQEGFSFSPDTYLQTELEASFIFEDTPDQETSMEEIKRDMERSYPMDRLVCGDVGFGKTEVAIRATAKAVADEKQVAILVPTTILAFQHYKTFSGRLQDFPARINYLSRFKSARQSTQIKKELAEGKTDIIIGTHKLLSKELKFKDLGLLIIDEEQKFGVAAKEKLRSIKVNVDTLSLTATPIPRTLQFSLMGVRDLSVMHTPPLNRQPIETHILTFDRVLIREAVEKELSRNGQVFFVHNRINDLEKIGQILKEEMPGAKIGMAHGRMQSKDLEEVMLSFIGGYYDVLLSTNIIESGLDIPNANTILINEAQNFGLSDLYQMRGRVGRSNIKAYCYLLIPSFTALTEEARKRLAAIEEFTDLGSGFHIAMRDLDIRGAGNLLGGEQSGFISEIGLEMYKRILDEALLELRDEEFPELFAGQTPAQKIFRECQIESDLELIIPDSYVPSMEERLVIYNKLNSLTDEKGLDAFINQLIDRFGEPPYQLNDLMDMLRMKWIGQELGVEKITLKNKKMKLYFPFVHAGNQEFQKQVFGRILRFVQSQEQKSRFNEKAHGLDLIISGVQYVDEALQMITRIKRS